MTRIIAVCNQKGGVGKTTTTTNTAAYLALMGKKVLLVDFDPQSNASSGLGCDVRNINGRSIYDGLLGNRVALELIHTTPIKNFHFIPAHPNLAGLTVELLDKENREHYLDKFIRPISHLYDYVIIDLPPSMSMLTVNGLVAADEIIIPVQCEYYGLEGLGQILETVDLLNNNLNKNLRVAGALLTMYDTREQLSREVSRELRKHFLGHVYEVEIPRAISLAEAPSFSKPICLYDAESVGAKAYERLARELISQELSVPSYTKNNFI